VVDESGRLVGQITVDDVVHIIRRKPGEDVMLLAGAGEGRHQRADPRGLLRAGPLADRQPRDRVAGLVHHLAVRGRDRPARHTGGADGRSSPASAGNAGTQTLAVTVRALATNQLTRATTWRAVRREIAIALLNGLSIALVIGVVRERDFAD
jgi:magnesium transporter